MHLIIRCVLLISDRTIRLAELLGPRQVFHFASVFSGLTAPHDHEFFEVFWVVDGRGTERFPGGERDLHAGAFGLLRPRDCHAFASITRTPLHFRNLAFAGSHWRRLHRRYAGDVTDWFAEDRSRRGILTLDLIRELESAATSAMAGRRDAASLDRLLLSLDAVLYRWRDTEHPVPPPWLASLVADRGLLRQGVAAFVNASGYSHEHVTRLCRAHLGTTPRQLVTDARLDEAARRLEADRSVTDAALDAGFNNLGHFHKLFRQRFGTTPRRYKARQLATFPAKLQT